MSKYITIRYGGDTGKSIEIDFTMHKAYEILQAITWGRIVDAEITDKKYEDNENERKQR